MAKELKQSHSWIMETSIRLKVSCAYCGFYETHSGRTDYNKGDHVYCSHCGMTFRLGTNGEKKKV